MAAWSFTLRKYLTFLWPWPWPDDLHTQTWPVFICANMNFLRQGFRKLPSDRQTDTTGILYYAASYEWNGEWKKWLRICCMQSGIPMIILLHAVWQVLRHAMRSSCHVLRLVNGSYTSHTWKWHSAWMHFRRYETLTPSCSSLWRRWFKLTVNGLWWIWYGPLWTLISSDSLRYLAISRDSFEHSLKTFLFSAYSFT